MRTMVRILTWGKSESEERRTFSGFKSQWTMFLLCKCFNATRIYNINMMRSLIIPHICHRHHRRCLCKEILSGVKFSRLNAKKYIKLTWVTRNFVILSERRPCSDERIISSMSPKKHIDYQHNQNDLDLSPCVFVCACVHVCLYVCG